MLNKLIAFLKSKATGGPKAKEMAINSFEEYQCRLLEHQDAAEYHARMVQYCEANLRRLSNFRHQQITNS